MDDKSLTTHELNVLRRFKLKIGNVRFTISKFAKFMNEESNDFDYTESRKRAKVIIDYELESKRIEHSDKSKTKVRFRRHTMKMPAFVINRCNTAKMGFNDLYIVKRLEFVKNNKYKCYMCGHNPKYMQVRLLVNTPYGIAKVVMCSSCNKVITEE